jgi:hypothetical protein
MASKIETRLVAAIVMIGGLYAIGAPAIWLLVRVAAKIRAI